MSRRKAPKRLLMEAEPHLVLSLHVLQWEEVWRQAEFDQQSNKRTQGNHDDRLLNIPASL